MYSVTFKGLQRRSRKYKTEQGALRAIWKWLRSQETPPNSQAIMMGPDMVPQLIDNWRELPFVEKSEIDFMASGRWRALKSQAFVRYGNHCACCGRSPADGVIMHVDHIKPRSHYPELEASIDNLQILCEDCNLGKSNRSEQQWRS